MFEFEDSDFAPMESFPLPTEDGYAGFEEQNLVQVTYLGDGVWVVDARENTQMIRQVKSGISEQ